MDNFFVQIQSIKSQIDNMKLQISNIEIENNMMNNQLQGEQLINLGIQMLNTGLFSINAGKCKIMTSPLIYHEQLENISKQINNIINEIIQQKQMIQQQCFMMQNQMINQINMNNLQMQDWKPKMNIFFIYRGHTYTFICDYDTKIKDVLDKFSNRVGKSKNKFRFLFNGKILDNNDERKIEKLPLLYNQTQITITVSELGFWIEK